MFRECFKGVTRVLQVCFKSVSRVYPGGVKDVSRKFKDKLSGVYNMFQALLRVFQGCSVSESLLLHATHRSYPSRRRACLNWCFLWIVTR